MTCTATDPSGNIDMAMSTVTVKSACQQLIDLRAEVNGLSASGAKSALLTDVNHALFGVTTNSKSKSCRAINAFISHAGGLPAAQRNAVQPDAQRIRTVLHC